MFARIARIHNVISDSSLEPDHYDGLKSHKVNEDKCVEEFLLSSHLFSVYIYRVHPRCITV
jgi:hypothetical protein